MKLLLHAVCLLLLGLQVACSSSGLTSLTLEASELHPSLVSKQLDEANHGVPEGVTDNPHFSVDPEIVTSIAGYATQGQLGNDGIRAALYALYHYESEIGYYGIETSSMKEADRLEGILREIWAVNVGLGLARVHRGGQVFLVVWNDGVPPSCWQEVNDNLMERLAVH